MTILPQLRDGLIRARPRRARRPLLVGLFAAGGLVATTGALAATGVLQLPPVGDPVAPEHVEHDPERGTGVATDQAGRLLALRVPDPAGGPPWGLRIVDTTRGMACLQAGRVVGEQLGRLGRDGVFHPLPAAPTRPCQLPDGAGRFYIGVDEPVERRRVAYGLLGPEATKVTYTDGSTQVPTEGDGAYLHVGEKAGRQTVTGIGGGPVPGQPWSLVARVDYRDGTHCPAAEQPTCAPKGYVEPKAVGDSKSLRRKVTVKAARKARFTQVKVRFRAPAPITDASREYRLIGRVPSSAIDRCRRVVMYVPNNRNVERGDTITLEGIVPNDCVGRLAGRVVLAATTERDDRGTLVGRFTLGIAGGPSDPR